MYTYILLKQSRFSKQYFVVCKQRPNIHYNSHTYSIYIKHKLKHLNNPIFYIFQIPENCLSGSDCMPMVISWEGTAEIQSGDVLIVEIDDTLLIPNDFNSTNEPK